MILEILGNHLWIGIGGAILIAGAWSYEMWEGIERHKSLIDLRFAGIYFIGTLLMLAYSVALRDIVFTAINATLALLVIVEIAYTIGLKLEKTKRRKGNKYSSRK